MGVTKFFLQGMALVALAMGLVSGCQKGSSDLSVTVPLHQAYLINAQAQSCADKLVQSTTPTYSIQPNYFSFPSVEFSWQNTTQTAYISAMVVEIQSSYLSSGDYKCTLTGPELADEFTTDGSWDGSIVPAATVNGTVVPTTKTSVCGIRCGGVAIQTAGGGSSSSSFSASGTLKVIGFQQDASGVQTPLQVTVPVSIISSF